MKALVTGARGFIGSFLVETLLNKNWKVSCLLRNKQDGSGDSWISGLNYIHVAGDITDPGSLKDVVADFDYVFHLAGCTKTLHREDYYRINVDGTKNLLDILCQQNSDLKRFVHVSSLAAAGPSLNGELLKETDAANPLSHYGKSKLKSEEVANRYFDKIPITIIRPPSVYGPRDTDVFKFFKYSKRGLLPILAGGKRTASFVYVKDLINGFLLAAEKENAINNTFYISDDQAYTWEEFGAAIASQLNTRPRKITLPVFTAYLASLGAEIASGITSKPNIMSLDKYIEIKMNHWVCSNSKAKQELGFELEYGLQKGIAETAEWYLQAGWL